MIQKIVAFFMLRNELMNDVLGFGFCIKEIKVNKNDINSYF